MYKAMCIIIVNIIIYTFLQHSHVLNILIVFFTDLSKNEFASQRILNFVPKEFSPLRISFMFTKTNCFLLSKLYRKNSMIFSATARNFCYRN